MVSHEGTRIRSCHFLIGPCVMVRHNYMRVYMKDKSCINFIFCICRIIRRTSTLPTCMTHTHTWEQWTRCSESRRERTMSDESITGCEIVVSLQLAFILLNATCHVQAMYTYVWPWHMVQSESDMIEYVSLRDWPYVMSRQNNQTERDQLMVNSLLYEWCTFPWL